MSDEIINKSVNEWVKWVDEAITDKSVKCFDYDDFTNIERIGIGGSGKVYRATKKESKKSFALKSFFNLNNDTVKEIVRELEYHRDFEFHESVIRFHGITKRNLENEIDKSTNYLLVMDYADGGNLRNYLMENFSKITWKDKCDIALQLALAVKNLHEEDILHHDLHSCNVMIHQKTIKLADFGVSKSSQKLFNNVPYIDPEKFSSEPYSLSKKSDTYSIGVLLWEISSGKPPFEGRSDENLAMKILRGLREEHVPNILMDYVKLYTDCWNGDPDKRPTMHEVVERLEIIINLPNEKSIVLNEIQNSLNVEFPRPTVIKRASSHVGEKLLNEKIHDIVEKINDITKNELYGFMEYVDNFDLNTTEIYNQLSKENKHPDFIFLLGYFNYLGIETSKNEKKAFDLFIDASRQDHLLAQYYVGKCYEFGIGTNKDDQLAFKYFKKFIDEDYEIGLLKIGQCCDMESNIKRDLKLDARWYEHAARNGNTKAMCKLGLLHLNSNKVDKDHQKAFELFNKSSEGGYLGGTIMLGYCYYHGIGTDIDMQKSFKTYQDLANLRSSHIAQYNLAFMYERGKGIKRDSLRAIDWYDKSAKQGNMNAQYRLDNLKRKGTNPCKII